MILEFFGLGDPVIFSSHDRDHRLGADVNPRWDDNLEWRECISDDESSQ
jgi:hypothetical protein